MVKVSKRFQRVLVIPLVLILTMSFFYDNAFATSSESRASSYFDSYTVGISTSGNTISVDYQVVARSYMDELGATQVVLQRRSGDSWIAVDKYTSSSTPSLLGENIVRYSNTVTFYNVSTTGTYRAYLTIYASDSSGADSRIKTTSYVYI